jgi:uncharacterized protein
MSSRKFNNITDARGGAAIAVRVVTRSAKTEIVGVEEDSGALKVRLMASPAGDPAANKELIAYLAERLDVPADKLMIVIGADSRDKMISVEGITTADVEQRLFGNAE